MNNKLKNIIIATGGTGGHIFPAYSLAKHFADKKVNVNLISDKRGMRYLKDYHELNVTQITSSPISKKNILNFFISTLTILYSIIRSFFYLLFSRADLVFGMGGYSSMPACIAAKIIGVPFIIYENNLHIGKANKFLLPFAKKIFVSNMALEGISNKYKDKLSEIGNIIRKEILYFKKKRENNKDEKKLKILILGGSQAAKVFAEKLPQIFKECDDAEISLKIYQQCLVEQREFLSSFYKKLNIDFEIFNFTNNILEYFSKIDLVLTRSGSSMLAELINAKIPFVSIPLPTSADDHQLKNAIYYEKNQYSYLIEEKDLSKNLFKLIKSIHKDRTQLDQIIKKQQEYSDKSVYENIDREITKIINEKN
jgi:UDP-N-acetylglucosamine--N-acetylmuramyl-(pentapeptide) pyrophosphoryl-undecaprenol N-acetylglucosamine transferase